MNTNIIETLNQYEATGMRSQPDIIWTKANDCIITDDNDKEYIDFSSGVMITNSGHNNQKIKDAIMKQLDSGIFTTYMFPNSAKADLLKSLSKVIPQSHKVALYSTGTEVTEAALKITQLWDKKNKPNSKNLIISYVNSFHGRTLGAQLAGGVPSLADWIPKELSHKFIHHVPFPDGIYSNVSEFNSFTHTLDTNNIEYNDISAVIIECYQGGVGSFVPSAYMNDLVQWCKNNNIILIVDEIQSGCGRTGKFWAYEHYGIQPDIILAGKGISSSLPLSALIAREDIINLCDIGTLNTTHSGNAVCCAAANANLEFIESNRLVENAFNMGQILSTELNKISQKFTDKIRAFYSKGLIACIHVGNQETKKSNNILAKKIVNECLKNGLMLYYPGGPDGATIKIAPPLTINKELLINGCDIIMKVLEQV